MMKEIFTPGRTELAGNHTDHQKGRILASAVDLGLYAKYAPNDEGVVRVHSLGYEPFEVKISQLAVRPAEFGSPKSLVRGMVNAFSELGLQVGGFDAQLRSTLAAGSGLSSSAAFSVMIGRILSALYNDGKVDPVVIARAAQAAENKYFGKPCGLMDQLACSLGHTVYVDFKTNEIVPLVADVDPAEFRAKGWDPANRPVRRAMHFFDENERVPKMRDALIARDGEAYMRLMNASGRSSEELLNNIVTSATGDTKLAEGLEKSRKLLEGRGAWRVHGGGFAGCVQALMPSDYFPVYKEEMEKEFGKDSCRHIRLV